jgi:hypothetical protein
MRCREKGRKYSPRSGVFDSKGDNMLFETLESRTLMSVSPISTKVAIDRLEVRIDLLKFRIDTIFYTTKLLADSKRMQADGLKSDTTLTPLFATLHSDVQNMWAQLRVDRLTQASNVLADQSVIDKELVQIIADKGNSTALQADHAQLLTDRIQLQNDEIAGLNTRLATRQADYTTIFSDVSAIATAVAGDPNSSPALTTAVEHFTTDRTNTLNAMTTDISTVIAARTTLVADLTALQS